MILLETSGRVRRAAVRKALQLTVLLLLHLCSPVGSFVWSGTVFLVLLLVMLLLILFCAVWGVFLFSGPFLVLFFVLKPNQQNFIPKRGERLLLQASGVRNDFYINLRTWHSVSLQMELSKAEEQSKEDDQNLVTVKGHWKQSHVVKKETNAKPLIQTGNYR